MKKISFLLLALFCFKSSFSQVRNVNKLTLESTYSYIEIHKSLRDLIDTYDKSSYFDDDFFNGMLKKIISDKRFSDKEKVQMFYLMQKKLGFAFFGLAYLPPKQNYFECQAGKILTYEKTSATLQDLHYNVNGFLSLADSNLQKDALLSSNALLLATLLRPDTMAKKIEIFSSAEKIQASKSPDIVNHYLCLCASLVQTPVVVAHLLENLYKFERAEYREDILCAIYAKNNSFSKIKDYVMAEKNQKNGLAIETALCILAAKVPEATFEKSVQGFISESKEKWKNELMKKILKKQVPFNYDLAHAAQIVSKAWPNVTFSIYAEGLLITDGTLLEFDPN